MCMQSFLFWCKLLPGGHNNQYFETGMICRSYTWPHFEIEGRDRSWSGTEVEKSPTLEAMLCAFHKARNHRMYYQRCAYKYPVPVLEFLSIITDYSLPPKNKPWNWMCSKSGFCSEIMSERQDSKSRHYVPSIHDIAGAIISSCPKLKKTPSMSSL